jgi:hypothetical protein
MSAKYGRLLGAYVSLTLRKFVTKKGLHPLLEKSSNHSERNPHNNHKL